MTAKDPARRHLQTADPVMARLIDLIDLPPLPESAGIYHDVVSCILDHQVPGRSRGVMMKKLVCLLGGEQPDGNNIYTIQEDDWRAAKISLAKYHSLFRFTDAWHESLKVLDWEQLSDDEIREHLRAIKGIGPATVDLVLLYSLGRPDVPLANDSHVKQMVEKLYPGERKKLKVVLTELAARWSPSGSLASRYLVEYRAALKEKSGS